MTILDKALKLARGLSHKNPPAVDPTAVIRSALGAAGLLGPTQPAASPDVLACFAPPGLKSGLEGLMPALRRIRPSMPLPDAGPEEGAFIWRSISGPWGERRYRLFTPAHASPPRGLVVMLHGCSQNPDDFAAGTQMNRLGQAHNLLVVYPEQPRSANSSGCWNWFNAADQTRGQGEPALIAAITGAVAAAHDLPPGRCFVAGLSAGGAMAAIMAETYPDLYTAAGIHSGLPYGAAKDLPSAFAAMQGKGRVAPAGTEAMPPMIILHGDADRTVHPGNADAMRARLTAGRPDLRTAAEDGAARSGQAYRRTIARDATGRVRFEDWRLAGAGHAWSGGSAAGSYTDPHGVDASGEMVRFFLERIGQPDNAVARVPAPALP